MLIRTGIADLVAVEAHCKTSNILTHEQVLAMALDPTYERALRVTPHFVAGMEMRRYLHETGSSEDAVAMVVVKNRRHALGNPVAAYGGNLSPHDGLASAAGCEPPREPEISPNSVRAGVLLLASEEAARPPPQPVWNRGV